MSRYSWIFLPVLFLLSLSSVLAYNSPGQPTGYVNDYADVLTKEQETSLETKLGALAQGEGSEMSVVTVNDLGGDTIENYAVSLFAEWGIGKEEQDNGLLLLVALEEREMRIEVGYGLEGTITDAQSYWIIRDVLTPAFKNGDYYTGIDGAVDKVTEAITGGVVLPTADEPTSSINEEEIGSWLSFILFIFLGLGGLLAKSKSIWLGGLIGAVAGGVAGFIFGGLQIALASSVVLGLIGLIIDFILSKGGGPGSGLGGGMFRGGGGFSSGGGFGGFGGGSSGGGGASGRW